VKRVDQIFQVFVQPPETRLIHLPADARIAIATITTDQNIWLSISGLHHGGGSGQTALRAGETITIEKPSGNVIEIHGGSRDAEVTAVLCYDHDPSAVDQLADLARKLK